MQYLTLLNKKFNKEFDAFQEDLKEIENDDDNELIYFQNEVIVNIFECNKDLANKFHYVQEVEDSEKYLSDVADFIMDCYNKVFKTVKHLCVDEDDKYIDKIIKVTKEDILYCLNKIINSSVNSENPFKFAIVCADMALIPNGNGKFYAQLKIDFDYLDHLYNAAELEDFDPFNDDLDFEYISGVSLSLFI